MLPECYRSRPTHYWQAINTTIIRSIANHNANFVLVTRAIIPYDSDRRASEAMQLIEAPVLRCLQTKNKSKNNRERREHIETKARSGVERAALIKSESRARVREWEK